MLHWRSFLTIFLLGLGFDIRVSSPFSSLHRDALYEKIVYFDYTFTQQKQQRY